jgi:hypothetical protein
MDIEKVVDDIIGMPDMEDSDKVYMFIQLCDEKQLMDELKKQGLMQKVGIVGESLIHGFAYAVLRIAKPHLFETPKGDGVQIPDESSGT